MLGETNSLRPENLRVTKTLEIREVSTKDSFSRLNIKEGFSQFF